MRQSNTFHGAESEQSIFLSKPNFIEDKYRLGASNFVNLLESHGLRVRSLGSSDYPIEAPMDEVIHLMEQCSGAVILGIPQVEVTTGKVCGEEITSPFSLATEWNHIETALAYSLKLPLLIIHDQMVVRGVFDRGTTNTFIHSVDLTADSWPLDATITGSLTTWKSRLK